MALDNANFIAELSITDPPGTDPLSQGDDHIRTTKRATQQSFPNIDKAVTITADQMNEMAIKNEANTFTQTQTISPSLALSDGGNPAQSITLQWLESGNRIFRWLKNQAAVDSVLTLERYNPAGTFAANVWSIDPTTGIVDFTEVPTIAGAPLWLAGEIRMFVSGSVPGTNWFLADGTNGTVDMRERVPIGSGTFTGSAGTNLNANLNATSAAGVSGSTAITEAQMPSHDHRVWASNNSAGGITDTVVNSSDNVFGGRRNDTTKQYSNSNGVRALVEATGGGAGHTHTTPAVSVDVDQPTFSDACRPLSTVVAYYQYVP